MHIIPSRTSLIKRVYSPNLMTKPQEVTDAEFDQEVLKAGIPVLVDFWAEWYGPCHQVAPILEALAGEFDGKVKFVKVDTEENFDTATRYGIRSLPTLLVFKNGQKVDQTIGARPKSDLKRFVEKSLV